MIFPILSQKSELNDKEAKTKDSLEILNILSEELKNF
jgi:hypothetical protein